MLKKQGEVYKEFDHSEPQIPLRSKLFSLEPIGIGTPFVESLTSYLHRLSEAHCLPVTILIKLFVIDRFPTPTDYYDYTKHIRQINGVSYKAVETISVVQSLTQRNDLSSLTLVNWSNVIPLHKLLRHSKAWCPRCYEEMRTNAWEIYDLLIWHLQIITSCLKHEIPLLTECPHCKRNPTIISGKSRPGFCSLCKGWLGFNSSQQLYDTDEWSLWVNKNVGLMLSQTKINLSNNSFSNAVKYYVNEIGNKEPYTFAKKVGVTGSTLLRWYNGEIQRAVFFV